MKQKSRQAKLKSTGFDELQRPMDLGYRKVMFNRTSKMMILPKVWADANCVEAGDKVQVIMEPGGTLSVRKSKQKKSRGKACPK